MRDRGQDRRYVLNAAIALTFLASPRTAPADELEARGRAILILDASGSMNERVLDGREWKTKITIARKAVESRLRHWNPNTDLGLMLYGHTLPSKPHDASCKDIELVVQPGPVDQKRIDDIRSRIDEKHLKPKGETPLINAVVQAADFLKGNDRPGRVILVTDGEESCEKKTPCQAAQQLAESGVDLVVDVIAFKVDNKVVEEQLKCYPDQTGGDFYTANDSRSLDRALQDSGDRMESTWYRLESPLYVFSELPVEVKWQGPNRPGDSIAIVPVGAPVDDLGVHADTAAGSPAKLVGPTTVGPHEVRYVSGRRRRVPLRLAVTVRPGPATVEAPASVPVGSTFDVTWTGPNAPGDRIALVRASDGVRERVTEYGAAPTTAGTPVHLRAPSDAGKYEVGYVADTGSNTVHLLARRPIELVAVSTSVSAPASVEAGAEFDVTFEGPKAQGDRIALVKKSDKEGLAWRGEHFTHPADQASPFHATAFTEPGEYEVRYMSGVDGKTLARTSLLISASSAHIEAPEQVQAAADFDAAWTGPGRNGDRIVLVEANQKDGFSWSSDDWTQAASGPGGKLRFTANSRAGDYELRYLASVGGKALAMARIRVGPAEAKVDAPARVPAGGDLEVRLSGPKGHKDRIVIIEASAKEGTARLDTAYGPLVNGQDSVRLKTPSQPGAYEVRYMAGVDGASLAKTPVEVVAAPH